MIFKTGEKDAFMAAYKFYVEDGGTEKLIGIIHEDGATLKLESDRKELPNGHNKSIYGVWKWIKNGRLEFKILVYDYETLALALPNSKTSTDEDYIKIKSGVIKLHEHTQKFIARPEGYEDDDTKKITIYAGVNDDDFELTFKVDEATTINFNLLCLKDDSGDFIDIGEDTTTT